MDRMAFAVFLLYLCQIQGSSALTPVFVQKGKDLLLVVMEADLPKQFNFLSWVFNGSVLVTFSPDKEPIKYNERVEIFVGNYSIKLKNLHEADSGVYAARVFGAKEQTVTQYNVTVQDPVSPPQLIIDSVPTSSGSCNVTVTCSTQDSHHINSTFTCDTQTCSQDGGETSKVMTSGASLQVYLRNGSIICNHSNQVSWAKDVKATENICRQRAKSSSNGLSLTSIILIIIPAGAVACLIILSHRHWSHWYKKRTKDKPEDIENTVYAVPEVGPTAQTLIESPANDASGLSPTSTYCLVGFPKRSEGSTETRGPTLPESLYAQVEKPARA